MLQALNAAELAAIDLSDLSEATVTKLTGDGGRQATAEEIALLEAGVGVTREEGYSGGTEQEMEERIEGWDYEHGMPDERPNQRPERPTVFALIIRGILILLMIAHGL